MLVAILAFPLLAGTIALHGRHIFASIVSIVVTIVIKVVSIIFILALLLLSEVYKLLLSRFTYFHLNLDKECNSKNKNKSKSITTHT